MLLLEAKANPAIFASGWIFLMILAVRMFSAAVVSGVIFCPG